MAQTLIKNGKVVSTTGVIAQDVLIDGETGTVEGMVIADRDRDCVPEIGAVSLPATLAARIRFTARRP